MSPRFHAARAALLVMLVWCAGAGPATHPVPPSDPKARLEKPLPEVKFEGVTLADALQSFSESAQVNLVTNWPDLEAAGAKRDAKVSVSGRNVKASDALRRLLAAAGPKAGYAVEGEVVYVATEKELSRPAGAVRRRGGEADRANAMLLRLLARHVNQLKFDKVRLEDALGVYADKMQLPLDVEWDALKEAGVDRDTLVDFSLRGVSVETSLYWVLRPLPAKSPVEFGIRNHKIAVGTKAAFDKQKP